MNILANELQKMGIFCTEEKINRLLRYRDGVLDWNQKVNLTAITDPQEFLVKHILDSLLCVPFEEYKRAENVIDVGTGAGFPGIPLAVFSPEKNFTLMDSLHKRLKIIDQLAEETDIRNVATVHARAEELARKKEYREKYDLCVSRAVANLTVLCEYCLPFVKPNGYFFAYKGPGSEKEMEEAESALKILGGSLERTENWPDSEFALDHKILIIKKIKTTPSKYPRKAGTPAKEPLK